MKIIGIHIDGFGKLHDFDIAPGEKVSVFFGCNEAGKTTLHLFIRSILYGASTKRKMGAKSVYERMRPWQQPEVYRGRIEIEFEMQRYVIERDFNKAADDLTVYELQDGEMKVLEDPQEFMAQVLNGLSETAYVNTVSSGQLGAATQRDMAAELKRYTANVSGTMNPDLDADKAVRVLQDKKNELAAALDGDAAKEYTAVLSEIKKIEEELGRPENDNKINLYSDAVDKVRQDTEELSGIIELNQRDMEVQKQALQLKGFPEQSDIAIVSDHVEKSYAELEQVEKKAYSKLKTCLIVLLLIAAAGLSAGGWILLRDTPRIIMMAAAEVCLVAAIVLIIHTSSVRKRWRRMGDALMNEMTPYIGVYRPGEEAMRLFREHVANAKEISDKIDAARSRQEALNEEQGRLNSEHSQYLNDLEAQHSTKLRVESRLERLKSLRSRAAELQRKLKANSIVRENLEAVELAMETIGELAEGVKGAAGTYINKEASAMVSAITNQAYDSVSAGVNYDIYLNSKNGMISVNDTSAGTADQVYMAVRLATIRFIAGEEDPLPLILDDSFNLFDDERLAASLRFLTESYKGQIMIFTCQDREVQMMDKLQIDYSRLAM